MTAIGKYGKRIAAMQGDIRLHSSFFLPFYLIVGFQCSDGNALRGGWGYVQGIYSYFFKLPVVRAVLLIKKEKLKICDITGIYKEADKVTH